MPEVSVRLKQKYLVPKQSGGGKGKAGGSSASKKPSIHKNLRPRRRVYGPF